MLYQNKQIEILGKRKTFGKVIAQIRILSTGELLDVPESELSLHDGQISDSEITYRAMASRIISEIGKQNILSPFESNVIPLPHQILALEKIMSGQFMRYLIADEVGMGKTIEAGLVLKELKLLQLLQPELLLLLFSAGLSFFFLLFFWFFNRLKLDVPSVLRIIKLENYMVFFIFIKSKENRHRYSCLKTTTSFV